MLFFFSNCKRWTIFPVISFQLLDLTRNLVITSPFELSQNLHVLLINEIVFVLDLRLTFVFIFYFNYNLQIYFIRSSLKRYVVFSYMNIMNILWTIQEKGYTYIKRSCIWEFSRFPYILSNDKNILFAFQNNVFPNISQHHDSMRLPKSW